MLSHACALSGPNSLSNHIQNAQYDYKTKLELQFTLIINLFLQNCSAHLICSKECLPRRFENCANSIGS